MPETVNRNIDERLAELRARRDAIEAEIVAIDAAPDVDDADLARFEALEAEARSVVAEIDEIRRKADLRAALRAAADRVDPESRLGRPILPSEDDRNTRSGEHRLSIHALIRSMWKPDGSPLAGLDAEEQQEIRASLPPDLRAHLDPGAVFLTPHYVSGFLGRARPGGIDRRAEFDAVAGAGLIQPVLSSQVIDVLRPMTISGRLGVRIYDDMTGPFAFPRYTVEPEAQWLELDDDAPPSPIETDKAPFAPKKIAHYVDVKASLLAQTSFDAERATIERLMRAVGIAVDKALFGGDGVGPRPHGLARRPDVQDGPSLGANGGPLTWAAVVDLERKVHEANAMLDERSVHYVGTPGVISALKTTPRVAGHPAFLSEDNRLNGWPVHQTNLMPSDLEKGDGTGLHSLLFGDFSQAVVALWGPPALVVNPFEKQISGGLRISVQQFAWIEPLHPQSFARLADVAIV